MRSTLGDPVFLEAHVYPRVRHTHDDGHCRDQIARTPCAVASEFERVGTGRSDPCRSNFGRDFPGEPFYCRYGRPEDPKSCGILPTGDFKFGHAPVEDLLTKA